MLEQSFLYLDVISAEFLRCSLVHHVMFNICKSNTIENHSFPRSFFYDENIARTGGRREAIAKIFDAKITKPLES